MEPMTQPVPESFITRLESLEDRARQDRTKLDGLENLIASNLPQLADAPQDFEERMSKLEALIGDLGSASGSSERLEDLEVGYGKRMEA